MSHFATNWAVTQRGIKPSAKVVLWQLADRHNPDHGCFPRQEMLADDCEMSRSSLNEQLKSLERAGLIKRVTKRHPVTKRQEPTRYHFAFEAGFVDILGDGETAEETADESKSRVQNSDTETELSRVQNSPRPVSRLQADPSPAGRTHNRSLTSKITSKGTGKRATGADRESLFEMIWKVFPMRPGSPQDLSWEVFQGLDDVDAKAALKGAERFAAWWREQEPGKPEEERLRYVKYLSRWLHERGWIDAARLPVAAVPGTDAAEAMAGVTTVNKWTNGPLFAACERQLGRTVPVGKSGSWSFKTEVVEVARKSLGSGTGPP